MKTIAVMSRKGGAGKSTLAVHMATAAVAAGKRVMLVDMDPQRSSLDWARERALLARLRIEEEPMKATAYALGIGVLIGLLLRR